MMNNKITIIPDEEINLNETRLKKNSLNSYSYINNLKNIISNYNSKKSLTIGLFGSWGSGKSSIIKTVVGEFKEEKCDEFNLYLNFINFFNCLVRKNRNNYDNNIVFVKYDAWKYSEDSFRRTFLVKTVNELGLQKKVDVDKPLYKNEISERTDNIFSWHDFIKKIVIYSLIITIPFILAYIFIISKNTNLLDLLQSFIGIISLSTAISVLNFIRDIQKSSTTSQKTIIEKPNYFSEEQFEGKFDEIIRKSSYKKLIFIIDNIDRCSGKLAYQLLSDIKTFLGDREKNLIFIIPVDDNILRKHIEETGSSENVNEFLRKIFDFNIYIKYLYISEMFDFADDLNKKYELNFSPNTIALVSAEHAQNPRRIIQTLNNLTIELNNFIDENEDFLNEYETTICYLLIIKEEFQDYFNILLSNPNIFQEFDKTSFFDGELGKKIDNLENLKNFLHKHENFVKNTPIEIVERILAFSYHYKGIPENIFSAIQNDKFDIINEFLNNKNNHEKFVNTIKLELETQKNREVFLLFEKTAKLYIKLTKKHKLPLDDKLNGLIEYYFNSSNNNNLLLTNDNDEIENIVWFTKHADSKGKPNLKNKLINCLNEIFVKNNMKITSEYVYYFIELYDNFEDLKKIYPYFTDCYFKMDEYIHNMSLEKVNAMINQNYIDNDFVLELIVKINSGGFFEDLLVLSESFKFNQFLAYILIGSITEKVNNKQISVDHDFMISINKLIINLTDNFISFEKKEKALENTINNFKSETIKNHSIRDDVSNYYIANLQVLFNNLINALKNKHSGSESNEEFIKILCKFYFICEKIGHAQQIDTNILTQFIDSPSSIISEFTNLIDNNISLDNQIYNIILTMNNNKFTKEYLNLLKTPLKENFSVTSYKINRIDYILNHVERPYIGNITNFLNYISNMNILFNNHGIEKLIYDHDEFGNFPSKIQNISKDFVLGNLNQTSDKKDLMFIAKNGNQKDVTELSKILETRLSNNNTLKEDLEIIDNIKKIRKEDGNVLIAKLEQMKSDEVKEIKEDIIKKYKKKWKLNDS